MERFTKITVGFVTQTFEKKAEGKFVCTAQEFIAGDQCDYEDAGGEQSRQFADEIAYLNKAIKEAKL